MGIARHQASCFFHERKKTPSLQKNARLRGVFFLLKKTGVDVYNGPAVRRILPTVKCDFMNILLDGLSGGLFGERLGIGVERTVDTQKVRIFRKCLTSTPMNDTTVSPFHVRAGIARNMKKQMSKFCGRSWGCGRKKPLGLSFLTHNPHF